VLGPFVCIWKRSKKKIVTPQNIRGISVQLKLPSKFQYNWPKPSDGEHDLPSREYYVWSP
jgi:hypothetical protein